MLRIINTIEQVEFKDTTFEVPLAPVTVIDSEQIARLGAKGVLMMANVDAEALQKTFDLGLATFWSRSREKIWTKGLTSGNVMVMRSVLLDCDGDALLYDVVAPEASCHNGTFSCFESPTMGAQTVEMGEDKGRAWIKQELLDRGLPGVNI